VSQRRIDASPERECSALNAEETKSWQMLYFRRLRTCLGGRKNVTGRR
jgi:hypothetical protein